MGKDEMKKEVRYRKWGPYFWASIGLLTLGVSLGAALGWWGFWVGAGVGLLSVLVTLGLAEYCS